MRFFFILAMLTALTGCAVRSADDVSVEQARAAAYVPQGEPKLTLVTVVNNTSGAGAHSALIVSGSQQVIFDPAGSFKHARVKERGDVLYGMSPGWVKAYKSAHARSTFHVVTQEVEVSAQQAEIALQLVQSNGPVGSAFCTNATSSLMRQIPGFEDIRMTFFPVNLMDQVATRSDVVTEKYYENDEGDVLDGVVAAEI